MRDTIAGECAVKEAGEDYLPKLYKQDAEEYAAYKGRAQFFNATDRTVMSLSGFIFRKNPTTTVDDSLSRFTADATMSGLSWYDYAKGTVDEVLSVGRRGTLIDFDAETENRPYLVAYPAEEIINWKQRRIAGKMVLSLLVLHEMDTRWIPLTAKEKADGPPDEFEAAAWDQWRVYRLQNDAEGKPYVQCDVYRKKEEEKKGEDQFVIVEQKFPKRRGQPLEAIPFVFHGPKNMLPDVDKIPLLDLAQVNLSLYRTSADLENGRHVAGIPTPWAAGFGESDKEEGAAEEEFVLGANVAWTSTNPQAKCGFLEFQGQGLKALETAAESKKNEMAALGARMLQAEAKKAEAFDTVAVRAAAEASALLSITVALTQSLTSVLCWVAWWNGTAPTLEEVAESETATIELNTEFVIASLPADVITAMLGLFNAGALDFESLFWKLQQGEMIPPDADIDTVRGNIEANPPAMIALQQKQLDQTDPANPANKPPAPAAGA